MYWVAELIVFSELLNRVGNRSQHPRPAIVRMCNVHRRHRRNVLVVHSCINRREDSTEFVVGFAGGRCLNSDCLILEARLARLPIDLLKPLGAV